MTKERLVNNILNIPISELGKEPNDKECFEGDHEFVHYIATKHTIKPPNTDQLDFFSVSVSGPILEKLKFIKDLSEKFGEPLSINSDEDVPGIIFAMWDAKEVTKRFGN